MRWLLWLFSPLYRLERKALKYGKITFQHLELERGLGWHVSLRAHPSDEQPSYAWTSSGYTLSEALKNVLKEMADYPIGGKPMLPHTPVLGGREFDPE